MGTSKQASFVGLHDTDALHQFCFSPKMGRPNRMLHELVHQMDMILIFGHDMQLAVSC